MSKRSKLFHIIILVVICLTSHFCANIRQPTGGIGDKTGPSIRETTPQVAATNVNIDKVHFVFNDFINRSTFSRAIEIEPDLGIRYDLDWGRKDVWLKFDEPFPDSTTIIISLGTDLSDMNSNKMEKPFRLAFSTGDRIDNASLTGIIKNAADGKGKEGRIVLLSRADSLRNEPAIYRAETDTAGAFTFEYLKEGRYRAYWVDDRNRNRSWEPEIERAASFFTNYIELKRDSTFNLKPIFLTEQDTTSPKVYGVGLLSSERINIRFSEDVEVPSLDTDFAIADSSGNEITTANVLFRPGEDHTTLVAYPQKALDDDNMMYKIDLSGVEDLNGNTIKKKDAVFSFLGNSQADTTIQRIVSYGLYPDYKENQSIEVRYARPIQEPILVDSIFINTLDEIFKPYPNISLKLNTITVHPLNGKWGSKDVNINLWNPKDISYATFNPKIWLDEESGELEVNMKKERLAIKDDTTASFKIMLFDKENRIYVDTTTVDSVLVLPNIAPKKYHMISFYDRNKNDRFDMGSPEPYVAPEPFFFYKNVDVKASFVAEIEVAFNTLPKAAPKAPADSSGVGEVNSEQ